MRVNQISVLYIDTHDHETCLEKFSGACRFASSVGWKLTRAKTTPHQCSIRKLLGRHKPDGCIVNATRLLNTFSSQSFNRTPVVFLDTDADLFDPKETVVAHDSIGTGRLAAQELLKLNLDKHFYMPYQPKVFWSVLRQQGFVDHLSKASKHVSLLNLASIKKSDLLHSGVFTANDEMALALLTKLKSFNLRVPDDVVVISADDTDDAATNNITSIRIDFEKSGYLSAQVLSELIDGRPQSKRVFFGDVCIRHRSSTLHYSRRAMKIPAAIAHIREYANCGLKVSDVVEFLGCSRSKAEKDFKTATGKSILEEIQNARLEHAYTLLRQGNQSIASIVDFCGYKTPQAMRKAFRLHTGMSMFEWRKRLCRKGFPSDA